MAPLTKASDARRITDVSPATDTSEELQTKMKLLVMSKDELVNAAADFTAGDTPKQTAIIAILESQSGRQTTNFNSCCEDCRQYTGVRFPLQPHRHLPT